MILGGSALPSFGPVRTCRSFFALTISVIKSGMEVSGQVS